MLEELYDSTRLSSSMEVDELSGSVTRLMQSVGFLLFSLRGGLGKAHRALSEACL